MILSRLVWAAVAVPLFGTAMTVALADIPPSVVTSADASAHRAEISAYIKEQTFRLSNEDAAIRSAARDALAQKVTTGNPSQAFVDVYIESAVPELTKLLADAKLETRLNAAIVSFRLSEKDRNAKLAPVAIAAMGDKQLPVILWGAKSAAQILPGALLAQAGNAPLPLLAKINETAAAHVNDMVAVEAYDALTLTTGSTDPAALPNRFPNQNWGKLVPLVLPDFQKFWDARLKQYVNGDPAEVAAEIVPARFVSVQRTWTSLKPDQQAALMQMLVNQLSLAGERAAVGGANKDAYIKVVQVTASSLGAIGSHEGASGLENAARAANVLTNTSNATSITNAVNGVVTAVKAIPKFSKLQDLPKISASTAGPG